MGAIFAYSLTTSVILAFLYLVYRWTMAGERQFGFNRLAIYIIYAVTFTAVPFCHLMDSLSTTASVPMDVTVEDIFIPVGDFDITQPSKPVWPTVLLWVYVIGMSLAAVRFAVTLVSVLFVVGHGERHRLAEGWTLVITDNNKLAPFSWFRYVVVSRRDYEANGDAILTHEMAHLGHRHWIDQTLANLVAVFQWYNPAAWLMIEELKTIHEYQADDAVIRSGFDISRYQYMLIEKAVGKRFPSPANSLNHSKLKKRVTMMYKSESNKVRRLFALAALPALMAAVAVVNIPAVASVIGVTENASLEISGKDSDISTDNKTVGEKQTDKIMITGAGTVKKDETYPSEGVTEETGIKVRTGESESSDKSSGGVIYMIDGKEVDADTFNKLNPSDIASISTKKNPDCIMVTTKGGKKSETEKWVDNQVKDKKFEPKADSNNIYVAVEKMAEFPGGPSALMSYLAANVKYPEEAYKKEIQGKVIVRFVVQKDGKIGDVKVARGIDPLIDREAVRVIAAMPNWIPAENGGEKVDSYFNIPVTFKLTEVTDKTEEKK